MFRAVIIGAPASGKGTISSRISKCFGVNHLSSGDLLRVHVHKQTQLGVQAGQFIKDGKLVPDSIMLNLILLQLKQMNSQNWLLDGFPRTTIQAASLVKNYKLNMAIVLDVPVEELLRRVQERWIHVPSGRIYNTSFNRPKILGINDVTGEPLSQRPDDSPSALQQRLQLYSEMVQPLLDFYEDEGILFRFAGRSSDEIWPHVRTKISNFLRPIENL